jgi:hypothetical protein
MAVRAAARRTSVFLLAFCLWAVGSSAQTPAPPVSVEVEGGVFGFTRNDVRDPGDIGTLFSFKSLDAMGPAGYVRVYGEVRLTPRQTLRLLYAPLQTSGSGALPAPTYFVSSTFAPIVPAAGTYKFNNYRVNWRYTMRDGPRWKIQLGAGVLIRDARIAIEQAGRLEEDPDLGFVPYVAFTAERRLSPRLRFVFDFEGLGSTQGRALDGVAKLTYDVTPHWRVGGGYRALEGGADVDSVFTFAFIHYGLASVAYRF